MLASLPCLRDLARPAALLGTLLIVGTSAPAPAAILVFVDGGGTCAGQMPCFTTIQAGVNNAGPAPAAVHVFPGTYNESVNLGTMGSAIAESAGNLTLRTVDAAGVPTQGGVSVLPAAGPALFNSLTPFPGTIIIDGFTVKSPNADGIALGSINGSVTLAGVVSDGNAKGGFTAAIGGGDVSVIQSSFSNNLGGDGLNFGTALGVNFEDATVDGNSGRGASFGVAAGVVGATRSSFSRNKNGEGLSFGTASGVIFDRVIADENQNAGASFGVMGGAVYVGQSSFSGAKNGGGLSFGTATDVTFDAVTADDNQNEGASFGLTGALRISRSSFDGAKNGGGLSFGTATDVTMTAVTADANKNAGTSFAMTGMLRVSRSSFSRADNGPGLSFATPTAVVFDAVSADGNRNEGASFAAAGPVSISGSSFSDAVNGDGLMIDAATDLILLGVVASGNSSDGLSAAVNSARITGSRFEHNGRNGILLSSAQTGGDFLLTCNDIAGNLTGLRVNADLLVNAPRNYWGAPSGPTHPNNPGGSGDSIVDGANGGSGTVIFDPFLTSPSAQSAVCHGHGAPAMQGPGLVLLLLALLILPARRLSRRAAAPLG